MAEQTQNSTSPFLVNYASEGAEKAYGHLVIAALVSECCILSFSFSLVPKASAHLSNAAFCKRV